MKKTSMSLPLGRFSGLSHKIKESDHLVHFYDDQTTLENAVSNFIIPGLTANQGVVIIAVPENIRSFEAYLEKRAIDVQRAKTMKQLLMLDAEETIETFMDNNKIDPVKFQESIGGIFKKMKPYIRVRAYGEMVNLLWHKGQKDNAIELERLWNNLATQHQFALLCGYHIRSDGSFSNSELGEVSCKHTHLITKDGLLKKV